MRCVMWSDTTTMRPQDGVKTWHYLNPSQMQPILWWKYSSKREQSLMTDMLWIIDVFQSHLHQTLISRASCYYSKGYVELSLCLLGGDLRSYWDSTQPEPYPFLMRRCWLYHISLEIYIKHHLMFVIVVVWDYAVLCIDNVQGRAKTKG